MNHSNDYIVRLNDATVEIPLRGFRKHQPIDKNSKIFENSRGKWKLRALDKINLDIEKGDRIGITGSNGSGKTTLLKVISGLLPLASGTIKVNGTIRVLLSAGGGISPTLTGRKNAELQYGLLNVKSLSLESYIENVYNFSQLGEFFDLPVNTYSPGMLSRLNFAANTVEPAGILLLDEWLGVADREFQTKARERLLEYVEENESFVFASHDENLLNKMTNRKIRLENGKLVKSE